MTVLLAPKRQFQIAKRCYFSVNIYKTALGFMVHIIDIQIVNDRYSKQLFEKKPTGLNGHKSGI